MVLCLDAPSGTLGSNRDGALDCSQHMAVYRTPRYMVAVLNCYS